MVPIVKPHNFMHADDYLVLEDESGRVKLEGAALVPSVYVTGYFKLICLCQENLSSWKNKIIVSSEKNGQNFNVNLVGLA